MTEDIFDTLHATDAGQQGETKTLRKLRSVGFKTVRCPYINPFDLVVDGARVEVKYARPNAEFAWHINIHRHGKVDESRVDAYIVCLDGVPGTKMPVYLIFPAPLRVTAMEFTFHTLLRRHHAAIDDWDTLRSICAKINQPKSDFSLDTV